MKEFLVESALPFLGVTGSVAALTLVLFHVPAGPPVDDTRRVAVAAPRRVAFTLAAPNDTLSRALRVLDTTRARAATALAPPATATRPPPATVQRASVASTAAASA